MVSHLLLVQGGMDEDMAASMREKGGVQESMLRALRARIEKVRRGK